MYRQTVRAHNLITTNSTGTLPFAKENCSMKVSSEKTIQQWYLYKPGTSYIKVKMRENDAYILTHFLF